MDASPPERTVPFNLDLIFRRGMGRRLLLCILAVVILPLVLVEWINYQAAYSHMEHDIQKTIRINAELKSQQIDAYFQSRLADAERQGRQPATTSFFNALVRRRSTEEETLSEFVLSTPWNTAVSAYGTGIQLHADLHGYPDILLIDLDGNVIFSNAQTGALAGNLNQAEMAASHLRAAFQETLETGKPVFSGFQSGVSEDNGVRAFITAVIGSAGKPPEGVIVFKIRGSDIQKLMNMPPEPGEDVRIYLIDTDLTLLAGTIEGQGPDTRLTIKTAIAQNWREAVATLQATLPPSGLLDYQDPGGHRIVGTYATIQPGHTPYALVVEIDRTMAFAPIRRQLSIFLAIVILTGLGIVAVSVALARMMIEPVRDLTQQMTLATHDPSDNVATVFANHELGQLATVSNHLITHLRALTTEHEIQSRFVAGMASLQRLLGGTQQPGELRLKTLEFLTDFLDLSQADFYVRNEHDRFVCACHFPGQLVGDPQMVVHPGEGRIADAAHEMTLLAYRQDASEGLVIPVPTVDLGNLITVPLMLQETVIGGLELKKTETFSLFDGHFLQAAAEFMAIAVEAAMTREKEMALLATTHHQTEKLRLREAALEEKTLELKAQSEAFQRSEQILQLKHLELEAANAQMAKNTADLEANMAILEQQKREMQIQNAELEQTHHQLAEKARQLEISSQYKTEFMANMSHELRTPLNSILLLSRLLMENKENTLSAKQAEFAQTIYSAGEDLINLINEILDLAKVESGKIEIDTAPVAIQSIVNAMQGSFTPLADQSGIRFSTYVAEDVPEQLISDRKRIEQIIKNFLSNAFKFTPSGSIRLAFMASAKTATNPSAGDTDEAQWLSISVTDTGIGIPESKQELVFDAFQQVDGSTRRKYGGTGLGLSISRELAYMLGGEITLESKEGRGSCFTLNLPIRAPVTAEPEMIRGGASMTKSPPLSSPPPDENDTAPWQGGEWVPDDRHRLAPGDPCILIMDADMDNIEAIMTVARDHGFKVLVAEQRMTGLHFADYYLPTATFVNLNLLEPDALSVVGQLSANPKNRHMPVFSLSAHSQHVEATVHGAAGHILLPPVKSRLTLVFQQIERWQSQTNRTVLVIATDPKHTIAQIEAAVGLSAIQFIPAVTANDVREALDTLTVDAAILHPSMDAEEQRRILTIWQDRPLALIIYAETAAAKPFQTAIQSFTHLADLKPTYSRTQLMQALLAHLHLPIDALDGSLRKRIDALDRHKSPLKGRKVLLVDDDMRTVFAVTSALEVQGVEVRTGKTGKESLDKLDSFPDIDLILMDVMIAEVNGYQAIREIRNRKRYAGIPILALTAKAMQGDRAKCIEAGADDYLAKPVNLDKLTSMLNIWLDPELTHPNRIPA